jgi:hypothetical protein
MKNIKILFLLAIATLIVSCESNTYEEVSGIIKNPTYTKNVEPIISSNCVSCHRNGNQYPDLDSYVKVKNACANGTVLCRIDGTCGNIMPQAGKMPQTTIDMIKLWASQGYSN